MTKKLMTQQFKRFAIASAVAAACLGAAIPAAQRENTFLDYADSFLQYVRSSSPLAGFRVR